MANIQTMLNQIITIINKEILDASRDGKSLITVLFMPILFSATILGSLYFLVTTQNKSTSFDLPVVGAEYAAPLMQALAESGINITKAPENYIDKIRSQEISMTLVIKQEFTENFRSQKTARVYLYSDHSNTQSKIKTGRIQLLISQWSNTNGLLRLLARGVNPEIVRSISVEPINITKQQRIAAQMLGSVPLFIMLIAFVSGIGMSADLAAGERERKSLEPLLINPVKKSTIFFSKWMASVIVTFVITLFGVALQLLAVYYAPLAELNLRIQLSWVDFMIILLVLLPIMFMATSLQLFVSFISKSYKDAQSYNSLIMLIPMIPGIYLIFNSGTAQTWQMLVPILGSQTLLIDLISGESISILHFFIAGTIAFTLALVFFFAGLNILKDERIIYR